MKLTIVIEKDSSGYFAYCPELEGCISQGDTLEEAIANIKEAVELYLETLTSEEFEEIKRKKGVYFNHRGSGCLNNQK